MNARKDIDIERDKLCDAHTAIAEALDAGVLSVNVRRSRSVDAPEFEAEMQELVRRSIDRDETHFYGYPSLRLNAGWSVMLNAGAFAESNEKTVLVAGTRLRDLTFDSCLKIWHGVEDCTERRYKSSFMPCFDRIEVVIELALLQDQYLLEHGTLPSASHDPFKMHAVFEALLTWMQLDELQKRRAKQGGVK